MNKQNTWAGVERRDFLRLEYVTPLAYKICKRETLSQLLEGYTVDVSEAGLLCTVDSKLEKDDIVWLAFDRSTLTTCEEIEKRCVIYQKGVIGKVVRIEHNKDDHKHAYKVGIQFLTREEKNVSHIYSQMHFIQEEKT